MSVGVVDGVCMLDLPYEEDSRAEVDMNVVMTSSGRFIEVQGTAEGMPFTKSELDEMLSLAEHGIAQLLRPADGHPGRPARPPLTGRRGRRARAHAGGGQRQPRQGSRDRRHPGRGPGTDAGAPPPGRARRRGDRGHPGGERPAEGPGPVRGHRARRRRRRHRARGRRPRRRARGVLGPVRRRGRHLRRQRGQAAGRTGAGGRDRPGPARRARFRTVAFVACPDGTELWAEGRSTGTDHRRGRGATAGSATTPSSSPTAATVGPSPR